jgi:class 3 adenylate cyclase
VAKLRRKNQAALMWVRAVTVGALSGWALAGMRVGPSWLVPVLAAGIAGLALASTELAVLLAVTVFSIPVIAVQPVVGFAMLIVLIASVRYLGGDGARGFIVIGASIAGAFLGPVWAGVALAGFVFGPAEGALAAAIACVAVEVAGIALGLPTIGVVVTGGPSRAIVSFAHMPASMLSGEWLARAFTSLDTAAVNHVIGGISHITTPAMLVAQPALWAAGAAIAGALARQARRTKSTPLMLAALGAGILVPSVGAVLIGSALGVTPSPAAVAISLVESLLIAGVLALAWERFFPLERIAPTAAATAAAKSASMATEDADVDELLRLIATAEDKLATQHTTNRVVMITDMKSFSRMTEEDGSVATAKAIQRHRDLLVPVIERHNGSGKSTGGDGLVASFESASDALRAAADMQRALAAHNAAHSDEREIWVRTGLASGEVVLDKGGRPFIGAALNLAARVMNLADGGQVFATADVARSAAEAGIEAHSFWDFELKNIAKPIEIVELLWDEGQAPRDPRESGSAIAGDDLI